MQIFRFSACLLMFALGGCATQFNMALTKSNIVSSRPDSTIGPSIPNRDRGNWTQFDIETDGRIVSYLRANASTIRADITDCANHSLGVDEFYVSGKSLDQIRFSKIVWFKYQSQLPITVQLYVSSKDLDSNALICVTGRGGNMTGSSFTTNKIHLK